MTLYVKEFTKFPGARYKNLGPFSGEEFREEILIPAIEQNGKELIVNLDGVFGYGSSFLEEIFGGCIRKGVDPEVMIAIVNNLVSEDDKDLIEEIREYVEDAISAR
ncbi:STAS-like domain-containing protein [Vibrio sp. JC009]|uniref:STAS-like domain-containing protein n=1 Tax=Vibrio sp. JC009 TaxID=2912314 RepID=UPI0023B0964D|nr:STAS-like domain-containing protein [Vibrio sp. JC009]WED23510.1 STAS-like domain-containing protein [Vibrio sp. JC009]